MKRTLFFIIFGLSTLAFQSNLDAQSLGGSGVSTGSGSSSSSSDSAGSSLGETTQTPEFQADWGTGSSSFVGRQDSGSPFIGREQSFDDSKSLNNRSTTSRSSTTRRSSSTRTTRRATTSRSSGNTTNSRSVRAETSTDFAFSPMEVEKRTTAFRSRMTRLPNLKIIPDQVDIRVAQTSKGTVATLKGVVPSQRDRKIVQQILLLEPGIDLVDNQLVVSEESKKESGSVPELDPLDPQKTR